MSELLDAVEIEPSSGQKADASVVWLHGLGADGHDFAPIVAELALPPDLSVRFVLPHAPSIPVTINGGMVMPAWYDIEEVDLQRRHDEPGVRLSADRVGALIAREHERGVPWHRIVLAGFSQGGAIALFAGLRQPERLAGIVALSTYLVVEHSLADEAAEANSNVPILQGHGTIDEMVPFARGKAGCDRLLEAGYAVDFRSYPVGHGVCPDEIRDVREFLLGCLR